MAGATPLGNMVIKLGLDDADFGKGVANSKKQVQYLAKEMQANMKVADLAGNKLGKLGTRYDGLTQIIKAQENQVTALKKAYDGSFVDGKATDSTKRLANQLQDANGKLANYKLQLQNTAGQMARLQVETQGVTGWLKQHGDAYIKQGEKIQKFGDSVSKVGSTLTKAITLPVAAGFTVATKAASDFTTQIGEIGPLLTNGQAITAEYKQQLEQMGESSKQWAKDYGVSTTEINQGLAEVVRKGYDANQTMGVMPAILDATKASGDAFNDVMNVSTEVISQFNLKGKDYETTVQNATRVTDSLTYVANATSAGFTDLGLAMSYVGPVANSLNMSVEETAAAIGLLSDAGIGGEKAGTALRGALTRLLKPSDQNIAGFEQLGISVDAFKEGTLTLPDILDKIKTNTQGWTDAQRTSAIALAFGTESQSAMNVLVNQGGDALRNLTSETESASGATKKIADSMKDLPANKVARFKESLNVLAITFGEKLLPLVTPWIEKATDMVNSFSELDDATQNNIVKWGLMAAAAGPALKLLGGGISVIGKTRKAVGLLSNGIVELAAASAEKKALPFLAKNLLGIGTAATTASGVGAAGASGAGVVGLGTAIAGLAGPIAIGVTALGAVAGAVYLGKKAYDEHQLAGAKWGTAVTEEQDKVISKSYELRDKAVSYVNEYADGVRDSADKAITANQEIVDSIKEAMEAEKKRKEAAAENLEDPETKAKADQTIAYQDMVDKVLLEQAQKRVDRINEILTNASKNNRELSDQERQYIEANYNQLSDKQLEQAGFSKNQRVAIETAYQDDLSKLSTKQLNERAKNVRNALDDEQSSYEEQKKSIADIWGENTQAYKVEMDKLDTSHKQATESMILGFAKLRLEQGYSLKDSAAYWEAYGWSVEEVTALVNSSVDNTTKNLDMLAKGTEEADIQWNQLALDPKTGEVRTNMADVLKDIASTDEGWEQLKFMAKNADISTNAKEEIAIAMGESGRWNELYLTEQQLLVDGDEAKLQLYDTIEKLGLWNQYSADRKLLGIDNADATYKLLDSEKKIKQWIELPVESKKILGNNEDLLAKVFESDKSLSAWEKLPSSVKQILGNNEDLLAKIKDGTINIRDYNKSVLPEIKKLWADNEDLLNKVLKSNELWLRWLDLPDSQKNILLNNEDLMTKVFASEESLKAWKQLPDPVKNMLGNNEDILSKVQDGTISVEDYNKNVLPALKKLFGDNSDIIQKLTEGEISLDEYDENNPFKKILEGDSSSTQQAAKLGREQLDMFAKNNPKDKSLNARDNATVPAKKALKSVQEFAAQRNYEVTLTTRRVNINERIDVVSNGRSTGQYATHAAQGTNFHKGGDMIVNDQPGPLYKEIVHEPGKEPYIPVGRNVLIPNAKRGTKVYKASRTKSIMQRLGIPKYADGVGIPEDSALVRNLRSIAPVAESSSINVQTQDYSQHFEVLIDIMSRFGQDLKNMKVILNNRNVVKSIETTQTNKQKVEDIKAGRRTSR
ncbi:phage tail tape measure protein [Enterococcus innesii]|uniref:phage tail tape measure protein n=1 Tax=Enterococcus innesii TaxID=2839759 RepID=UPI0032E464DF